MKRVVFFLLVLLLLTAGFIRTNVSYAMIDRGSQNHPSSGNHVSWEISDDWTITFSNGNAVTLIYIADGVGNTSLGWGVYKDRIVNIERKFSM